MGRVLLDAVGVAAAVGVNDDDDDARLGRRLLGSYLNSDPDNQVYVFMFAFSLILFSVPPLLKLRNILSPPEVEPEAWDYEAEIADLNPGGGRRPTGGGRTAAGAGGEEDE